jgi:hypothetical protein
MFFPRLRHAKWMFVFPRSPSAAASSSSVSAPAAGCRRHSPWRRLERRAVDLERHEQDEKNPQDIQAWKDLSTALQTDGQTQEAIDAQKHVVALAPKDTDALRELAALNLAQVTVKQQEAQLAQLRTAYAGAGQNFPGSLVSATGQSLLDDRISVVVNQQASSTIQKLVGEAQTASAPP